MNADLYEQFLLLKNSGRKSEAKVALDSFIASFETPEEKKTWVSSFLNEGNYGHKIRHEIYEKLIYPVLLAGYLERDVDSIIWLVKTVDNLYEVKPLHPALEHQTDFSFLQEAYTIKPNEQTSQLLLNRLLSWFSISQHEWPSGILYGMNGASREECKEILCDVEFARQLDIKKKHGSYLSDFEMKVREYMIRVQQRV